MESPPTPGAPAPLDAASTVPGSPAPGGAGGARRGRRWLWVVGVLGPVALIVVAGLAVLRARRDPQRMIGVYVPGVRLGQSVTMQLQMRYRLHPGTLASAPLAREFKYTDPGLFVGPPRPSSLDGFGDLAIVIGDVPADPQHPATERAPASRVALSLPTADVVTRVERRLRDAYGRPETRCFAEGLRAAYWPGADARGTLLVHPLHTSGYAMAFAARVVFGAERWEAEYGDPVACGETK
jgi:hypothetical protein